MGYGIKSALLLARLKVTDRQTDRRERKKKKRFADREMREANGIEG